MFTHSQYQNGSKKEDVNVQPPNFEIAVIPIMGLSGILIIPHPLRKFQYYRETEIKYYGNKFEKKAAQPGLTRLVNLRITVIHLTRK